MTWASELPSELLIRPLGLVALTGLDTTYNAVHKAIWDSFCNNRRADRLPLNFKVFSIDHEYPKCKTKRSNYEPYIPKGILKSDWMKKQTEEVPALVVVFFDLDWDDAIWREKQMGCSTKIEIVRNSLANRGTRVCVVLVQKNAPLPPGEDVQAAERAASLCSACELSAKSLFVLPLTDHLLGYTIRLENAFYEMVQGYYHTEARRVKSHKDFLNKTLHQLLYVRHQFKIGFFSEMKQDTHTALKHYKQAYGHILETAMYDTNLLEVKTIAGFINFKVCRLSFQHNTPLDSIAQFRKHIDFFKDRVGPQSLAFEHSAWMSKQFQLFGDLFDDAIKLGLTAIQTQHPGFYLQQAANHARARKQSALQLCQGIEASSVPGDFTESLNHLDFFGQRPWRQAHQSIEPPDMAKENEGISHLQALEYATDHSTLIIPLLSNAVQQFKKYKSPRMKRFLMVRMGEEYYDAKDYTKSLTLLSRVTWDYRQERWWPLLTSILQTAIKCAYLVGNVQEYITICLEIISKYTLISVEDKTRIQNNLVRTLNGGFPDAEPGCHEQCSQKALELWRAPPQPPGLYTIEMNTIVSCVECKACFTKESFTADKPVVIKVFMRSSCPLPIKFSKLSVQLNSQAYKEQCVVSDNGESSSSALHIQPDVTSVHTFSFLPTTDDIHKTLEITSVVLELGKPDTKRCAILHFTGGGGDTLPPAVNHNVNYRGAKKRAEPRDDTPWQQVEVHAQAKIIPRISELGLKLEHAEPCLVGEVYKIDVVVVNDEKQTIRNVRLDVGLLEPQGIELANATHISLDKPEMDESAPALFRQVPARDLDPGQRLIQALYLTATQTQTRKISARVHYDVTMTCEGQDLQCACVKEESVVLKVQHPFTSHVTIASMQLTTVQSIHAEEPFLVICDLQCTSPWPIEIQTSRYQLEEGVKLEDKEFISHLKDISLQATDNATECQCLSVSLNSSPVKLGQYYIRWRRRQENKETDPLPFVETRIELPQVQVENLPLLVDLDLPAYGNVRQGMLVTFNFYNRSAYAQEIETSMEASESFMFCGQKGYHFRILPGAKYQLKYTLVPLLPGNCLLPKLHINMVRYPGIMDSVLQKMLPSHVYVMPSGKTPASLNELQNPLTI